jgi:hypothetical protein
MGHSARLSGESGVLFLPTELAREAYVSCVSGFLLQDVHRFESL